MEVRHVLLWVCYALMLVFGLWVLGRIIVWQVARFMRVWFKIDIIVASVGLFCANGISVRVNDLQSLEIDKVSLKIRPKSRHLFSLHFGDVRIRAERNLAPKQPTSKPGDDLNTTQTATELSESNLPKLWKLIHWLAEHISLNIDALNVMLLNAVVPESLLHLDLSNVYIAGGGKDVVESGIIDQLSKSNTHQVHEVVPHKLLEASSLGLLLSVDEVRGKVLKSSKGSDSENTCIVQVTSSLNVGVVASQLKPQLKLEYVGVDLIKLNVEIHSAALTPGLLYSNQSQPSTVQDIINFDREIRSPLIPLKQAGPIKAANMLPSLTQLRVSNIDFLAFGDPLPSSSGIMADVHSRYERGISFSVSAVTLSQRKDPDRMVSLSTEGFASRAGSVDVIELPTGYVRMKIEDFNISTMSKLKLLSLSRVSAETKMTSNCVLSSSLDFTLCYMHFNHKEVMYWTELLKLKLSKITQERPHVTFASPDNEGKSKKIAYPGSGKMARKNISGLSGKSKGEGINSREIAPSHNPSTHQRHKRTQSAPNNFYHAEDYYVHGTPKLRPKLVVPKDLTSLVNVFNALGISTVCECTFYEAVIDATLPKTKASESCTFSFGFDCITMSLDHSANSQDINFMTKLDRMYWKPRRASFKDCSGVSEGSGLDGRWSATEGTPYHKTDIHEWGTALSLDTLRLHGQATFGPAIGSAGDIVNKTPPKRNSFWPRQHIAISTDAKIAGVQLEFSQTACHCIACILVCFSETRTSTKSKSSVLRQSTSFAGKSNSVRASGIENLEKYSFSLAFAELEVTHINMFLLPSDTTGCVDCLIVRVDSMRSESNITDRRFNIEGVGVSTVHNPYFSAFASYESGYHKGGIAMKATSIPWSVRLQQMKVSQYHCVPAIDMQPLHAGFGCLDVEFKVINREEPEDEFPSYVRSRIQRKYRRFFNLDSPTHPMCANTDASIKSLSISLSNDRDIVISWSPKLHMLVHHEFLEMYHILRKPRDPAKDGHDMDTSVTSSSHVKTLPDNFSDVREKYSQFQKFETVEEVSSAGDGLKNPAEMVTPKIVKQISFHMNSRISFNIALSDTMFVEFLFHPIRYMEVSNISTINFTKAQVIMDGHEIFTFRNIKVELSLENEKTQQDRASFSDMVTKSNRAWQFELSYWSCHFPYGYDFAATFDQFVTTFKWVKGLYRKTSHPFRSPKLPPDLRIVIEKFVFELADWDFECRLHDNHELMKDEWKESEKRRNILNQRVADLRRKKGELLPGKKIDELYLKLEEQNTKIYVERCRKFHASKLTSLYTPSSKSHIRSISLPVTTPLPKHSSENEGRPGIPEVSKKHSQARSRSFSFFSINDNAQNSMQNNPPLFSWSMQSLSITVLADKSMHGMDNAVDTLKAIDAAAPFPEMKTEDSDGYDFVTLWCRNIKVSTGRFQCRLRNYPQYLMNIVDWKIWGKLCGAEQKGSKLAQRTEYVPLPAPWGNAKVNRNMPALKFYHDLSSDVQTFNMAWGPCWDPAFSQVNLALNLLNRPSIDPSVPMPWWDKARVLFHGRLMMSMDRSGLLQLASLDPYNTTEHLHWDWKAVLMDWTNGNFMFKGDLDIHIRNASKYDDIRFLHLPGLKMEWDIKWLCKDGANPNDHHAVEPRAPDKVQGETKDHDSFCNFRSQNLNLSVSLDVDPNKSECDEGNRNPEILFYSSTLRWLTHFMNAINGVTRPVCKGDLFKNHTPPKLKLSRHYKTNTLSFKFPSLKMRYWSSYAQQLGVEWQCGEGSITTKFRFTLMPFEGPLVRRSRGDWSLVQGTCELSQTKVYLTKRGTRCSCHEEFPASDGDSVSQHSTTSSVHEEAASRERGAVEANFLFSLSHMSYRLENDFENDSKQPMSSVPPTPSRENRGQFVRDRRKRASQRNRKVPTTPRKPPSQHRHHLVIHDLRAMWTTDNRDVAFGIYEGYNKAAILKRNLSTKVLKNILLKPNETVEDLVDGSVSSSEGIASNRSSTTSDYGPEPVSPGEKIMKSANSMLNKLLSESDKRFFVGPEVPEDEEQLKGVSACQMDDVINQNWRIKFFNCQAMLKGPKTQGYIILTAAEADLINREHKISWRDGQLTSKSSWMGSLNDMQIFATVDRNVTSSGKIGENVPWLTVTNIERRGPSPGMLDISDLMTGGQAFGGVVADGVSAGLFQLQRIMSRCSCRMYYVGYEFIVDSEETDYGQLLPSPTHDHTYHRIPEYRSLSEDSDDLIGKEKPVNILTVVQPDLEICTNNTQYSMILDIVENLLLYVEPGMREHWERVDRMRFQLQLTSMDDVVRHRDQLARLQDEIRQKLNNIRQLERDLFKVDRMLEKDDENEKLKEESADLRQTLVTEKETLKQDNEELGIIIRCFKELYLKQKTRSSAPSQKSELEKKWEEDAAVARRTEVSFSQVKWHLTDADGQLTIAKFELRNFLYEKVNKSDDAVEHHFELGWLWLQNLLPNSIYADVLKPQGDHGGTNSYTVVGSGSRRLALRALCKVKPPVGGISIKELLEFDVVPLIIQLTDQFFKRMMAFFFPGKNSGDDDEELENLNKDTRNASLLGLSGGAASDPIAIKPKPISPSKQKPSLSSSSQSLTKSVEKDTPTSSRKNWHSSRMPEIRDDIDKMKQRAAKNNTFLYIKIPQFPLCVSYKGQKENNFMDIRDFNLTIPMLVYHNMTWTWHDLAMAVKKECTKTLLSQVIKEKFHLGSSRSSHKVSKEPKIVGSAINRSSSTLPASSSLESDSVDGKKEEDKIKLLFGTHLKRSDSARKSLKKGVSMFKKKK